MMERKFATFFHHLVHELVPDNGERDQLFDTLREYQKCQELHPLLARLRQLLNEPQKLELYEFIRPLILLRHQMEYSYLAPAVPGVRLRTIRLQRQPGQSLGFAVRGGYEFGVGVFVSVVEPASQAEKQGLKVGDEIVRVNGFTIAEAIHEDVLNLIKSRDEIVLKVTHIGMLPIKENVSQSVSWQYVDDMNSKVALARVLEDRQVKKVKPVELKIFIDCSGHESIGCGILSGPHYYPGIFVEKVRRSSLAEEAGLEVGDQLVEVNENSFLNIGHKEAVVVLKGSKQLNVVVRKHAGLPLFEKRQQTSSSRSSQVSGSGPSQQNAPSSAASYHSVVTSQQREAESNGLDERQLIDQQLRRGHGFGQSSYKPSSDAADPRRFFVPAEVHSDSDSNNGGSRHGGPRIPVEEFNSMELDGRELSSFVFPKNQDLGIQLEGGIGTPLGGKIVVAAVFDGGAAVEHGLQTGDQLMMVNGRKMVDITVTQAEHMLEEAQKGPRDLIHLVYAQSSFLNDEECVTYF